MFGALYGDIIGSYYETHCTKDYNFSFSPESTFTDDSVLTVAVCKAILLNPNNITFFSMHQRAKEYALQYKQFYSYFPHAGFGQMFQNWANDYTSMRKQRSYGNGAAMRAIPIGYAYSSLEQVLLQAKASCLYTHNHPEAIKGAQAVASAVWMALHHKNKREIKEYIEKKFKYNLSTSIKDIRTDYKFDSRTRYSVPPAIIAFLDSTDYESAIRNAISLGGDADTMACIAGGIAEAFYKEIPQNIQTFCDMRLESTLRTVTREFYKNFAELLH